MDRRRWLQLSAGAMLGAGLWPGCQRAAENGRGGSFRFVVINDGHFQSPKCPAWFARVRTSILSHKPKPEFCLMVGDLAEHGTRSEIGSMRDVLISLAMPFHAVPGNHDHASDTDRGPYDELLPGKLNYQFEHRGWRFIGLDSTEATHWQNTHVQPSTFSWLDDQLPRLNSADPTVVFTHFPMGEKVTYRPVNADDLLERFKPFNLVAVFDGHFHGFTERKSGRAIVTTNRCCAISRDNHDGTKEKGYFICDAADGAIKRQFIEVEPPS
jgi:3',5'-cyclic AMP phosphodiesterase CpdA